MNVTFIGGGVMGEAILSAGLAGGVLTAENVTIAELVESRRTYLQETYGVSATADAQGTLAEAEAIVVAVKPQELGSAAAAAPEGSMVLSIVAGVPTDALVKAFNQPAVIRVMPNTPATIGEGMSVWTSTPAVTGDQRAFAKALLSACGLELFVSSEKKLDMATALSGSGPAYVFFFIEALIEGGVNVGLSRIEAETMAVQTVIGAAKLAAESESSAADLRARVTSPAGTTAAGLHELEKAGLRAGITEAIRAAYFRSIELGSAE